MPEIAPGIEVDAGICHGKPVLAGTRVPVATVLGALAAGDDIERVADDYGVGTEQIRQAIAFAADGLAAFDFHPVRG